MSNDTTIAVHIENARRAVAEGRFEEALKAISAGLLLDATNRELLQLALEIGEREEVSRLETIEQNQSADAASAGPGVPSSAFLTNAHRLFLAGELDNALAEVNLALLADPNDQAARNLEREIREAMERRVNESSTSTNTAVRSILLVAKRYLERKKLDEALDEVRVGLEIDPENKELQWLRNAIEEHRKAKSEQMQHAARAEALFKIREHLARTEFQNALAELNSLACQFPADEEIGRIREEIEAAKKKWDDLKRPEKPADPAAHHVRNARQLLRFERLDEAAAEIALGLLADPLNLELKKLEKELWEAQAAREELRLREEAERKQAQQSVQLKLHLLAAEEFLKHNQFGKALDEIVQAYLIDPLDPETKRLESKVRQFQQRASAAHLTLVYKSDSAMQRRQR